MNKAADIPMYYTLVTAQIVFETIEPSGDQIQMLTQSTFGSSPSPNFPADYLLQLQNTLIHQVKQKVDAQRPGTFSKALDVCILALQPLGFMTHDEFWGGMKNIVADGTTSAPPAEDNVVPLRPDPTA